jgi:DNA adenine methylase
VTSYIAVTAVFLDPPYDQDRRSICYSQDHDIAADVLAWCRENGQNPKLRIALCGYAGEHDVLEQEGWSVIGWKAGGGYGRSERGKKNRTEERIWFSPACLNAEQGDLFR